MGFRIATFLSLWLLTQPSLAQTAGSPPARAKAVPYVQKNPEDEEYGFRILHEDITVDHFVWDTAPRSPAFGSPFTSTPNWTTGKFSGTVTITSVVTAPHIDSLAFDLGFSLAVTEVTVDNSPPLSYPPFPLYQVLRVPLERRANMHDTVHCTIRYVGSTPMTVGGMVFIPDHGGVPRHPPTMWATELLSNLWFPTHIFRNNRITWTVTVTAPRAYRVISTGTLVSDRVTANLTHTVRWEMTRPASPNAAALVLAPLATVQQRTTIAGRSIPVEADVDWQDTAQARYALGTVVRAMHVYSRLTGIPFPWPRYTLAYVSALPSADGGMDQPTLLTFRGMLPDAHSERDRPRFLTTVVLHQLAHEWFGSYVSTSRGHDAWFNEAFAGFLTAKYWGAVAGPHAALDYLFFENQPVTLPDPDQTLTVITNNTDFGELGTTWGPRVLYMLEGYLGPTRFWHAVHIYLTEHAYGNGGPEEFQKVIQETTGEDLTWFFNEWVHHPEELHLQVSARYDAALQRVILVVHQTQADSISGDAPNGTGAHQPGAHQFDRIFKPELPTAHIFHMPVTIRVGTAQSDIVAQAVLDNRSQVITIDHVSSAPTMIDFDDSDRLLKTLSFDQPTAWLTTLLTRERAPWQTQWAIQQLRLRADTDSAAKKALLHAITHGKYPRTRAQAVLTTFPYHDHVPRAVDAALDSALHDTSALVRATVVEHPHWTEGRETVSLLQSIFAHDSSDLVRIAVTDIFTRYRSPTPQERSALMGAALALHSYNDTLAKVVLHRVIFDDRNQSYVCDSAVVYHIETLLGKLPKAVYALKAIAGQCPLAKQILTQHLDDPRPYVRYWLTTRFLPMN